MFNSNVSPNYAHVRHTRLPNLSDLRFDLLRSLKVKFSIAIGLVIYVFLLVVNSNIGLKLVYKIESFKILMALALTFQFTQYEM